jgi:hypothetical protein
MEGPLLVVQWKAYEKCRALFTYQLGNLSKTESDVSLVIDYSKIF